MKLWRKEQLLDHYFIKRLSATLFMSKCSSKNKSKILRQTKTPHVVKKDDNIYCSLEAIKSVLTFILTIQSAFMASWTVMVFKFLRCHIKRTVEGTETMEE